MKLVALGCAACLVVVGVLIVLWLSRRTIRSDVARIRAWAEAQDLEVVSARPAVGCFNPVVLSGAHIGRLYNAHLTDTKGETRRAWLSIASDSVSAVWK
jgi:hypothetical protein